MKPGLELMVQMIHKCSEIHWIEMQVLNKSWQQSLSWIVGFQYQSMMLGLELLEEKIHSCLMIHLAVKTVQNMNLPQHLKQLGYF